MLVAAVVHVIQDYVLAPRILGRRVRVSPFTVILAVTAFVPVIGVAGAVATGSEDVSSWETAGKVRSG